MATGFTAYMFKKNLAVGRDFDLQIFFLLLNWIGYFFSPLVGWLTNTQWDTYLLDPSYLSISCAFAFLSMVVFCFGYNFSRNKNINRSEPIKPVNNSIIIILLILFCVTAIIGLGGISDFWDSAYERGAGQFDPRDAIAKLQHISLILNTVVLLFLSTTTSINICLGEKRLENIFYLLITLIPGLAHFSRAAGFPLLILGLIFIMIKKINKKNFLLVLLLMLIAYWLGNVGLNLRGDYKPGLKNYIDAALESTFQEKRNIINNPLDSTGPFTRKIAYAPNEIDLFNSLFNFVLAVHPLPSEYFGYKLIGPDLADVMGTWGKSGLTTPFLADIYFLFKFYGLSLIFLYGFYCGKIENLRRTGKLYGVLLFIVTIISIGIGFHQGLRAVSRFIYIGLLMILISKTIAKRNDGSFPLLLKNHWPLRK
jgi:hypothetical protein